MNVFIVPSAVAMSTWSRSCAPFLPVQGPSGLSLVSQLWRDVAGTPAGSGDRTEQVDASLGQQAGDRQSQFAQHRHVLAGLRLDRHPHRDAGGVEAIDAHELRLFEQYLRDGRLFRRVFDGFADRVDRCIESTWAAR